MRKYKVEFEQKETFLVDVYAKNETDAIEKAQEEWNNGSYQETGDIEVSTGTLYDVTETDDPFCPLYPIEEIE